VMGGSSTSAKWVGRGGRGGSSAKWGVMGGSSAKWVVMGGSSTSAKWVGRGGSSAKWGGRGGSVLICCPFRDCCVKLTR